MWRLTAFVLGLYGVISNALQCKNDDGNDVDTWLIIKAPKSTSYLYVDPETAVFKSPHSLNDTTVGALAHTTKQMWGAGTYVSYNDEAPQNSSYSFIVGHTKGYFFLDDDGSGVWVQHSIPNFVAGPDQVSSYQALGANAWMYGQHLYCMSLNAEMLDLLSYTFLLNRPNVYDSAVSTTIAAAYKNITKIATGDYTTAPICAHHIITTVGGQEHTIFGKSTAWNKDLWEDCVAQTLQTNLFVESWIRGSAIGPSCPTTGYSVLDVQSVAFPDSFDWTEYNDHSKWAVSSDGSVACFGDINRMTTQYTRGGGTVCLTGSSYATFLLKGTASTNTC